MCFSASASFGASALLAATGVTALKRNTVRKNDLIAAIPFVFAVQQCLEGFVWLALESNSPQDRSLVPVILFLIFAQVVWPTYVPLSFYRSEQNKGRKKILLVILLLGICVSCYLARILFICDSSAKQLNHHILYQQNITGWLPAFSGLFYFIPTVLPSLFSSIRKSWLLGLMIAAAYLTTKLFFPDFVISIWCYFAALISIIVYFIIYKNSGDSEK
ncbi:MAG: hypothetical protein Fur0041_04680 [Bacteroidia bacterium]